MSIYIMYYLKKISQKKSQEKNLSYDILKDF